MQQLNVVICGFDHYENIDVNPSYEVPEALVRDGIGWRVSSLQLSYDSVSSNS